MSIALFESASAAAGSLAGCRFIDAEFIYRPRPAAGREQCVFDWTLLSRLSKLSRSDAVLLICDSLQTVESLAHLRADFPLVRIAAIIANPLPAEGSISTPYTLNWDSPESWRRYQTTDRWARLDAALEAGSLLHTPGYLIMPAHDAVWGNTLLERLLSFSRQHARGGQPAAVSPYTYHQHSSVPGADIPADVIDLMNTAYGRDSLFRWKIRFNRVQQFWGKMSLMPFAICGHVRERAAKDMLEDDLVMDRVIREVGYNARCTWISEPAVYRQALPVFDPSGVRGVIERTLHYSLNIPEAAIGSSTLNFPLDWIGQLRRITDSRFARLNTEAEAIIAECTAMISQRLQHYGASWVDWGNYRYVVRVGKPAVEVWMRLQTAARV
jgi:hypothetical protein